MKRAVPAIVAGLLAAGCASAPKLSAREIVAKNAAARGGLDAWRKVETMVWTGHIESARAPASGMPFTLEQKRRNRTRLQIEAMGEESVRVFDGSRGWKLRQGRGRPDVQPYTPQELSAARTAHGFGGPLIEATDRLTLEGVDELDGRQAYHLKAGSEDVWVDARSFLEIRYDRMVDGPAGTPRRVSIEYGDYRSVDGLRIPFLIRTGNGSTPDRMQIEKVVLNAPLDDAAFSNPSLSRPVARRGVARR